MDIMHRLQQSIGTCTGIGNSTSIGIGDGTGAQGMDYCLTVDGLVRFRDRIYLLDNNELKKVILREFHVKP